jgi:hypothetical protein
MINVSNSLRWALIGHSWGIELCTGYPVIIVVEIAEITEEAITSCAERDNERDIRSVACIFLMAEIMK